MSQILDARALAEKLMVTPATILAWARRGWIPCLRASRRPVLFDEAEVQQALKERANRREDLDPLDIKPVIAGIVQRVNETTPTDQAPANSDGGQS